MDLESRVAASIERIRPYLQGDGGDISLVDITDDGIVRVKLHGACGTCPYSMMTLRNGVEESLRRDVPEIKRVEAVDLEGM
ncbi:MAG: NifU family protein [Bacteroidales bacterium]|nr:NifU family protein [Bacteroidales bacterium]